MNINFNNSTTAVNEVSFNGNTNIQKVNVDGTNVWFKAPTVLEAAQGLYTNWNTWIRGNFGSASSSLGSSRYQSKNTNADGGDTNHTETFTGYSLSGTTSPLGTSPTTTAVFIQYGDDHTSDITSLKVNGTSVTTYDKETSSPYNYTSFEFTSYNHGQMCVALGHTSTQLKDITSTAGYFKGGEAPDSPSYARPSASHSMLLPGKWEINRKVSAPGSTTIQPGEVVIAASGYYHNKHYTSDKISNNVTTTASLVFERYMWWYHNFQLGVWTNKTSSNVTFQNDLDSDNGYGSETFVLRHIGI